MSTACSRQHVEECQRFGLGPTKQLEIREDSRQYESIAVVLTLTLAPSILQRLLNDSVGSFRSIAYRREKLVAVARHGHGAQKTAG